LTLKLLSLYNNGTLRDAKKINSNKCLGHDTATLLVFGKFLKGITPLEKLTDAIICQNS
jgi:hypothetical protein